MFFRQGVSEVVLEICSILWLSTGLGSGVVYRVRFWTHGSCFHHGKYVVLALVGWWQWSNTANLPGLSMSKFSHCSLFLGVFTGVVYLIAAHITLMGELHDRFHGQVHPSIMSPSVC